MGAWVLLFVLSLLAGGAIVVAMVSPRLSAALAFGLGTLALAVALMSASSLMRLYDTSAAVATAVLFIVSASVGGYVLACALLPRFAPWPPRAPLPPVVGDDAGLVIITWTEPDTYDLPSEVAAQQSLVETGALELPSVVLPIQLLARKSRYRAAGGRAPAVGDVRALGDALATAAEPWGTGGVRTICAMQPRGLADAVAALSADGRSRIGVVVLGPTDAEEIDEQRRHLSALEPHEAGVSVRFAPSLLRDDRLAERLANRIMTLTHDVAPSTVGVVLVSPGVPESWRVEHQSCCEDENYFDQRVRMLLAERGLDDRVIRQAWIDWQTPDVTEAARHVAALGCERIIIAPSTVLLPTLYTAVDLEQIAGVLRLPDGVGVVTLQPGVIDEELLACVRDHARDAVPHRETKRPAG